MLAWLHLLSKEHYEFEASANHIPYVVKIFIETVRYNTFETELS